MNRRGTLIKAGGPVQLDDWCHSVGFEMKEWRGNGCRYDETYFKWLLSTEAPLTTLRFSSAQEQQAAPESIWRYMRMQGANIGKD